MGIAATYKGKNWVNSLSIALYKPTRMENLREEMKAVIGRLAYLETSFYQDKGKYVNQWCYIMVEEEMPSFWVPEEDLVFFKRQETVQEIEREFEWRDQKGVFHKVEDMETRHLYYTLRMIWNHSVPEEMKLKPYKRYQFDCFYTPQYIAIAVRKMMRELIKRTDITPIEAASLKLMIHFQKRKELPDWLL